MNQQIVIQGQLISYFQSGEKNADTTLLFLHGWRSQKEVWHQVIKDITNKNDLNVNALALDLPGFGQSPITNLSWKVGDFANLVAEFINKLNLKNVCLVGHSFGGRVAIKLASTRIDIIKKVVLVDSAGFPMNQKKKKTFALVAKLVKPVFRPKFMQSVRKQIYKVIGAEDYVATPKLQEIFLNTINEDLTENMKRILQPSLVVFGEKDTETPVEYGEKMHELILNSKFKILKDAGHFSFLDKPQEFVEIIINFIRS